MLRRNKDFRANSMSRTKRLLVENVAWAAERAHADPAFFATLARGQSPRVLWIGCSDSRVPAEAITNAGPGELDRKSVV